MAQRLREAKEVQHQAAAGHLTKTAAKAKREHIERALESETAPKLGSEAIRRRVPRRRQYPSEVQTTFVTGCTALKKSISSCECVLAKFEESKVEMGQSIAEMAYLEARLRLGERVPRRIQRRLDECKNAHA
jgi:hypothetical protein